MDSPVEIPYQSFIKTDRDSEVSLYMQFSGVIFHSEQNFREREH
jgi:GntR family transcriptional regulator/MocR family aminotransferase